MTQRKQEMAKKDYVMTSGDVQDRRDRLESKTMSKSMSTSEGRDRKRSSLSYTHQSEFDAYLRRARQLFDGKWNAEFDQTADIKDFILIKTLGTGSFGRVMLSKHKAKNDRYYAMKMLDKRHVVRTRQVEHVHNEIRLMDATNFEFLIHLEFYFKDNCYLYLVMQFINGGEMFTHLRTCGKFDETMGKFYAAQVVLGIEYLHSMGVVYRDLKPENILIDKDGYIKITDFGFCKKIDDQRTWTLCGTPEYLAPEIILSQGYNKSVDWWSLGILIYELVAGYPPFYAKDHMKLYDKIVAGKFTIPSHFSKSLHNLVINILQVDRTKRYGVLRNGSKDVKCHEWFKSVDWDALLQRKIKPSYRPKVTALDDTSNFDPYAEDPMRECSQEEFKDEFAEIRIKQHNESSGRPIPKDAKK